MRDKGDANRRPRRLKGPKRRCPEVHYYCSNLRQFEVICPTSAKGSLRVKNSERSVSYRESRAADHDRKYQYTLTLWFFLDRRIDIRISKKSGCPPALAIRWQSRFETLAANHDLQVVALWQKAAFFDNS